MYVLDAVLRLSDEWRNSGIEEGDTVLIHSSIRRTLVSLKTMGVKPDPAFILDSFLDSVGEDGTLLFPLFNFSFPSTKFFDIRETPSQMGVLSELARKNERSVRTGHPIYSFAVLGKNSHLFEGVDNISGYGEDSPFAILRKLNGKIASLSLEDQKSMTFYHHVEEMEKVDYRYFKDFAGKYIDEKGNESNKTYRLYVRDLERGVLTDVNPAGELMWQEGLYKGDRANEGSGLRTINSNDMYAFVANLIHENRALGTLYSIDKDCL